MSELSNIDIEKFFVKEKNEDLKRNFKKVISSDSLTKYIDFKKVIAKDKSRYPFLIMNTSRKNHPGVHWWSISNIDPKKELFLFNSEGFEGFKVFKLSDDKYIIDKKVLYNVKQFEKKKIKKLVQ